MSLRDAIGKDFFIIEFDTYTDADLEQMSTDDIETLKMRVNKKINGLSTAIKAKQIERASGGEGSTKEWYMNHKYALSMNQHFLPYINNLIKKRRRTERSIGDLFMDQAKKVLDTSTFENILDNAQREIKQPPAHFTGKQVL